MKSISDRNRLIVLGVLAFVAALLVMLAVSAMQGSTVRVNGKAVSITNPLEPIVGETTNIDTYDELSNKLGSSYAAIIQHAVSAYLQQTYAHEIPTASFNPASLKASANGDTTLQIGYGDKRVLNVTLHKNYGIGAAVDITNDTGKPVTYSTGELDVQAN